MSSEHVEVLERLRGVLEHGKMGDKCLIAPDLVEKVIAALSAPQPPAEAQAHGGGEVELRHMVAKLAAHVRPTCGELWAEAERLLNRTAPPSAPVGVEGLVVKWKKESESLDIHPAGLAARRVCAIELEHALAQQPAAAVEDIMVNAAHDVYTLPLQPSGLSSGPRFVVHVPAPEQPAAHPAITHCDNCGCDWLDNGLNPIGCPYCKQNAWRAAYVAERATRYREGGMKIEQARIHAETDAARIAALAAQPGGSDNDR